MHEYWFCWSGPHGREHGAQIEGSTNFMSRLFTTRIARLLRPLPAELGCAAAQDLSEVTAESDVIFTVVTDDQAMRNIFAGSG